MPKFQDVYEQSDPDEEEKRVNAHRGGGGSRQIFDSIDNYDYDQQEIVDDEEIEEEEAFNDSDEERYGSFFQNSNDHSEAESFDEDDEEAMDLSDLLQSTTKDDPAFKQLLPERDPDDSELMQQDSFSDMDDSEDDVDASEDDQEKTVQEESSSLLSFIQTLDKKSSDKKRKRAIEKTEAYDESEFALKSRLQEEEKGSSSRKSQLEDMMNAISEETGFASLKNQLDVFQNSKEASKIESALAAPLPKRIQDKFVREAAYDEAKKSVSKWIPLVKKMRESDHLSFPMNETPGTNMSSGAMVGQFQAATDMEKEIQNLLNESALTEAKIKEAEELELNKLSPEEVFQRRAELSKMRALLFFKEQKQKKIAKIKSKIYRKLHRKSKGNDDMDVDLEELKRIDPEAAREKIEKLEAERAKERVTLKHKNTGKWAKQMLNKKDADEDTRMALLAQLDKHEQLKKKIKGLNSDDDSDTGDVMSGDVSAGLLKLETMKNEIEDAPSVPKKGLFAMKFMQKAMEKEQKESLDMIKEAHERLMRGDLSESEEVEGNQDSQEDDASGASDSEASEDVESDEEFTDMKSSGPTTVWKKSDPLFPVAKFVIEEEKVEAFKGHANAPIPVPSKPSVDDTTQKAESEDDIDAEITQQPSQVPVVESESSSDESEENPWLAQETSSGPLEKSRKLYKQGIHTTSIEKAGNKFLKQKKKLCADGQVEASVADGVQDISDVDNLLSADSGTIVVEQMPEEPAESAALDSSSSESASESDSDIEQAAPHMVHAADIKKLSHLDIMRMTFENDDLVADFEQEKAKVIDKEKPKEEDLTLPGWGSWSGSGIKPKARKVIKQVSGVKEDHRQDAKLKHVILNEKRLKKSSQYLVPNVPHGFENKDQYEKVIRTPVGKEWNTQNIYRDRIKPKVETKLGSVIRPMKFVSAPKSNAKPKPVRSNKKL